MHIWGWCYLVKSRLPYHHVPRLLQSKHNCIASRPIAFTSPGPTQDLTLDGEKVQLSQQEQCSLQGACPYQLTMKPATDIATLSGLNRPACSRMFPSVLVFAETTGQAGALTRANHENLPFCTTCLLAPILFHNPNPFPGHSSLGL